MKYIMLGAPPGRRGSAFLPGMPISAKALHWGTWGGPDRLAGSPGTLPIPTGRPNIPAGHSELAMAGTSRSSDAPDHIRPSLYYVRGRQEHAPVSLLRTNNMPVPASGPGIGRYAGTGGTQAEYIAQVAAATNSVGGRRQVGWPATAPRWPWRNRVVS